MNRYKNKLKKISPFRTITLSFLLVILIGSLLLMLPAATAGPGRCSFPDALFTSCSAVCVTGLVVRNTATYWSAFGKGIILLLIQIGGLGVITVIIAVSIFTGRRIGLRERNLMQNSVNAPQIGGIIRFTRFLLFFTVLTEGAGALLLLPVFIPEFGLARGLGHAVFHSVSAFCNAGFDLLGDPVPYSSLVFYHANVLVNIVIMALIVTGGLGFLSWEDMIVSRFRFRKMRMQTRIILTVSALLILVPAVLLFLTEFRGEPLKNRILMSLFQSVTTRTAGFNTADFSAMTEGSKLLMLVLMLIGGSPGSTAGGLKTTTFAVILMSASAFLRQRKDIHAFERSISFSVVHEAFTLLCMYVTLFLSGTMLLSHLENLPVLDCMFESASALGTVGLTTGITPALSPLSRCILILFMYFGRVGGLTLAYSALATRKTDPGRLPEGTIMVG